MRSSGEYEREYNDLARIVAGFDDLPVGKRYAKLRRLSRNLGGQGAERNRKKTQQRCFALHSFTVAQVPTCTPRFLP